MGRTQATVELTGTAEERRRDHAFDLFRRLGYLEANLDPLGDLKPESLPELNISGEAADAARAIYANTTGVEFMHIGDPERRRWIQERMESQAAAPDRMRILERLVRAEVFEEVLQTRYLGTKRYSLEGNAALIPLLDSILDAAAG